jgi:protein ImuA
MSITPQISPEAIHPSLWRASQLARGVGEHVDCGYAALSAELPGAGWPAGAMTELLIQHPGTAELRLLQPALASLQQARIVLLQAPYQPQALALSELGLNLGPLLWIRCKKHLDALWAAEQILRSGSCGALLFWQSQVRTESLRRLHLAAQGGHTLFFMIRPLDYLHSPSPAPLRIKVKTVERGLEIDLIKRRGAQAHTPLLITMPRLPSMYVHDNATAHHVEPNTNIASTTHSKTVAGPASALPAHRKLPSELVG